MTVAQKELLGLLVGWGFLGSMMLGSAFLINALFRIWWAAPPVLVAWGVWVLLQPWPEPSYPLPGLAVTLGATYLLWRWGREPGGWRITAAAQWACWGVVGLSVLLLVVALFGAVYHAKAYVR
jgi:hypothetical protein